MVTSQPSITNCPKLLRERGFHILFVMLYSCCGDMLQDKYKRYSGDYGTKVPPLPIPNREVKLRHADGTAQVGE